MCQLILLKLSLTRQFLVANVLPVFDVELPFCYARSLLNQKIKTILAIQAVRYGNDLTLSQKISFNSIESSGGAPEAEVVRSIGRKKSLSTLNAANYVTFKLIPCFLFNAALPCKYFFFLQSPLYICISFLF